MDFKQTADKIESLLRGRPLDGWEIFQVASRNLSIEVKEQKVDTFTCSAPAGVSIRVLTAGRMGFSFSTSLDEADLGNMIDNALVGAENQTADEFLGFPLPEAYPDIPGLFDEGLSLVGETEKIERAVALERLTLASDPRVKRVRKASYGESSYEVAIRNSLGVAGSYGGTSVSCSVSAVAEEGGDSQMGWDFGFSTGFAGVQVEEIAGRAAAKAAGLLGARKIPTMRCPAILDNYVATEILEVLAPAFLAENVQKGKSLLAGREGARLFAPCLRIRDDGTLAGGMATAPFDGEGAPRRNTVIVEDGVLRGFLYDSYCARREGKSSTGNAARGGVKGPPRMGMNNFFIENGPAPAGALLEGIARGILVTSVMGMHTANPISGDFSVGAAGFLIENGAVTVPVKGIAIAGNILDLFGNVEKVGDDLRFFGSVGSPSLRIAALDVSGE
ncbi:MAG TPA: TldD/PmbA family protein [Geobacteraceae bacterium]|nr:TldD/PmbA family protein [Geobacteraceae bacterium]